MTGSEVGEIERGGRVWERSSGRDSNTGRPKRNDAVCRCAAHKAIGADIVGLFGVLQT